MKPPVTRIRARSFRSMRDVDVELGPLSVLAGPNGSGKSNLLKVLQFMANSARLDVGRALEMWGGFGHVVRRAGEQQTFELVIEGHVTQFASEGAPDSYRLRVTRRRDQRVQRTEELTFKRVQGRGRRITVKGKTVDLGDDTAASRLSSPLTSGLGTLARLSAEEYGPGPSAYMDFLESIRYLDPDVERARQPARLTRGSLAEDAGNLADVLWGMQRDDPDAFAGLVDELSRCLPGLRGITMRPVGGSASQVVVELEEAGLSEPIPLEDASFGTVRMLSLLAALHDPSPPRLTVIEEVDHGLHPYALDILVDRMRAASTRTQIIAATHSPTLVNRLRPDELVLCDRDPATGESLIPACDADELAAALGAGGGYGLGELWFAGAIGGVPQ